MTPGPGIAKTPLPKGFTAGGVNSGIRKYRLDTGIIISDRDAVCAGVFTKNECRAAPVLYAEGILPSSHIRAIITNSGQANAATGAQGKELNWQMALSAAQAVSCTPHQVVTASTGVIGAQLDIEKLTACMPTLVDRCGMNAESFAVAILTTDLYPKTVHTEVELSGGKVMITGICKGSGMIHPNMATMLGYILTDAELEIPFAQSLIREASDTSFNMISVDGDTSTNDCAFIMANGASGVKVTQMGDVEIFKRAVFEVSTTLAKAIARDGEGATKLVEVQISGAPTLELAKAGARGVTMSPLVKSAIYGNDPNWGRILGKLGAVGMPSAALEKMTLKIQGYTVFENGAPTSFDRNEIRQALKTDTVIIQAQLFSGDEKATAWGCDLTAKYVEINAEYS